MSVNYQPVLWNKFKKQYDLFLWIVIIVYLVVFISITILKYPAQNINTTLIRAFGTLAVLLLHLILIIGPLNRLSSKFLPLLYNRRHLGVSMFVIALVHGLLSLLQFHGNGNVHPLVSLFTSNLHYDSLIYFPYQTLGFAALLILAAMAFTSHDFWLHFLSPKFWKVLHMLVYLAYGLVMLHVALGIIQFEKSPFFVALLVAGFVMVASIHQAAAFKEKRSDLRFANVLDDHWKFVCGLDDIEEGKAKMTIADNERIAVFKYDGKLSAVHNVCKHQMGPLGEGKVVDGCITCPWHGYQYRPEDGCAPAPFTEKVATYNLQLRGNQIFVHTIPMAEGSFVEPLSIPEANKQDSAAKFFIGWANNDKRLFTSTRKIALISAALFIVLGIVLSGNQKRLSGFAINYNTVNKMEGWLSNAPVPNLRIVDGKDAAGNPLFKTILLMDGYKFGADAVVKKVLNGDAVKYVRLTGYLSSNVIGCSDSSKDCIPVCTQCIIGTTNNPVMEIENGQYSFEAIEAPIAPQANAAEVGSQTLRGEIIDPKCYFGAMNPGHGKAHLSCAVRCISGGIMPVLKYEVNHQNRYAVITGLNGEAMNAEVLNVVGLPVEISGNFTSLDHWGILRIPSAKSIRVSARF